MDVKPPRDLVDHLCRISALSAQDAQRLVCEVMAFYSESSDEFIRRRHLELQGAGMGNSAIFQEILLELPDRRFPCGPYTTRQIRRVIYG